MRMSKLRLDTRLLAILFSKAFHVLLIVIHTDWGESTDWSNCLIFTSLICCYSAELNALTGNTGKAPSISAME